MEISAALAAQLLYMWVFSLTKFEHLILSGAACLLRVMLVYRHVFLQAV